MLSFVRKQNTYFPEYLASLPTAGYSGTLQNRFKGKLSSLFKGNIRAKTGSLSSPRLVSTISGYLWHKKHGQIAFAFLQNEERSSQQRGLAGLRYKQEKDLVKIMKLL